MQENHPTPIPADPPLSTRVRHPKPYLRLDGLFPPLPPPTRRRAIAAGAVGLAVTAVLLLGLWRRSVSDIPPHDGGGQGGLPAGSSTAESETLWETEPTANEGEAEADPTDRAEETVEPDPDSTVEPDLRETAEPDPSGTAESDTDETIAPNTDSAVEPDPNETAEPTPDGTVEPDSTEAEETAAPPIPEGCLGFVYADMSETALGAGYVDRNGYAVPESLPSGSLFKTDTPTVLIVNTRPYEGYGGGADWYDPASGGLALTDTPNHPHGVVALGTALAQALRERGITVIHLRIAVSPDETAAAIRSRTEEAIRYYCRLYPAIGLVLDLRRSSELTADGSILATRGTYDGGSCAQLRISVSSGRSGEAPGYDLAAALALRRSLWEEEPTISRPVRLTGGVGIVGDLTDLRVLTLEAGSAGNTYAEAWVLAEPLGRAIAALLKNYG